MMFKYDDGGRSVAGYKGDARDCVVRAIAIATGEPYDKVYETINMMAIQERPRKGKKRSNSRTGVFRKTYEKYLKKLGWIWTPTMQIGQGCKVHLRADELPPGRLVVSLSRHIVAVIDGVVHDTHDPARGGTRCVYGYYQELSGEKMNHFEKTGTKVKYRGQEWTIVESKGFDVTLRSKTHELKVGILKLLNDERAGILKVLK